MMTPAERSAYFSRIGKLGGAVRASQFTRESQQAARAKVSSASCSANGKKGFAAYVQKYGAEAGARLLADWRRKQTEQNPHCLIRVVLYWVTAETSWTVLGTDYELIPGRVFGDIVLQRGQRRVVIECDGQHWHTNNPHVGFEVEARGAERDALLKSLGVEVIHLPEADIRSEAARPGLLTYLEA